VFASADVGTRAVTASGYSLAGAKSGNYSLSAQPVVPDSAITAKDLLISATDCSKKSGNPDPVFTVSYSGFIAGDSSSVVTGLTVTREPGEKAGTYIITPSGALAQNYTIEYATAFLTITNTAPVLDSITGFVIGANKSFTVNMDRISATDIDGDTLTLLIGTGTNFTVSGTTITPKADFAGTIIVPFQVTDGSDTSNIVTLEVLVRDVFRNKKPGIDSVAITPIEKNSRGEVTIDMIEYFDGDDDPVAIILGAGTGYSLDGFTIIPDSGFTGMLTVPVRITDGIDTSDVYSAKVSVFEKVLDFHKGQEEMRGEYRVVAAPNPAPPGTPKVLIKGTGDYDRVDVRIYDNLGNVVESGFVNGNENGFEYSWRLRDIRMSGTFVAFIQGYRDGKPVKKQKVMIGVKQ
jgi:hypothetical protein